MWQTKKDKLMNIPWQRPSMQPCHSTAQVYGNSPAETRTCGTGCSLQGWSWKHSKNHTDHPLNIQQYPTSLKRFPPPPNPPKYHNIITMGTSAALKCSNFCLSWWTNKKEFKKHKQKMATTNWTLVIKKKWILPKKIVSDMYLILNILLLYKWN